MAVRARPRDADSTPVVGGYRLEGIVSEEPGFHVLYDGIDTRTDEHVSVKVYVIEPERRMARQFVRAARRRAAVEHPHLLKVHDSLEWEGRLVLATEPCDLLSVAEGLMGGAFTPGETIEILSEVAAALDAAAEAGIVDHELSPATILLDRQRGALLGDLGVVTSLSEGLPPWAFPYPQHIAPEILRGEPLEPRSNVYSLASVMLECLTGRPPFEGSLQAVSYSHAAEPPPRASERDPTLGEDIDVVLAVALAKAPADRFATSRELVDAASGALGVAPARMIRLPVAEPEPEPEPEPDQAAPPQAAAVPAPAPPGKSRSLPRPSLPRRIRFALVAVPLAAAIAAAGYLVGQSNDSPRPVAAPAPPVEPTPELVNAARTIDDAVARLDRSVSSGRARLAAARTPAGQARMATGVSRAYRAAAATVAGAGAPRGLDASALRAPLADASRGYARLARAARAQNRRAFGAAQRDIRAAEGTLRRDLAALR
jgi:serine/threonine-protein kinase